MIKLRILSIATLCAFALSTSAQQTVSNVQTDAPSRIGRMSVQAFQEVNAKGTQMLNAITPTSEKLSAADQALFNQVAMGGMRQLAISQAVVGKANSSSVRLLAQSEVDEQTAIAAKLREVAAAKGATLPTDLDATATALVQSIGNASGTQVDALYLDEGGIRGHQLLETTMKTVKRTASDATMKALAVATLPVIKTHLKVSKKERQRM
jgi:putative membrane protein